MICERLTEDHNIDASDVSVEVTGKVVKLTGLVDNRQTKFQIEDLVERCGGVKDIDNQLRVQPTNASSRDNEWSTSSQGDTPYGRSANESRSSLSGPSATTGTTTSSTPSKRN